MTDEIILTNLIVAGLISLGSFILAVIVFFTKADKKDAESIKDQIGNLSKQIESLQKELVE